MHDNELIDLNFAPGIKAADINHNFNTIHGWITRERLRIGGYGIVEGFDLSYSLKDFTITVSEGIIINDSGEEVIIPEKVFHVGPPEFVVEEEEITCPEDGILSLKYRPYSEQTFGYIEYIPPNKGEKPLENDISLKDKSSEMRVPIMQLINNKIYIDANFWNGKKIKIKYKRVDNRIDSIMLYKDGSYKYEKSIASTSPSHVDLGDYIHHFCIAVVYWNIDVNTTVEFFTNHRSLRKVYVDKNNNLYLNGELYVKPKFIYFVRPEDPQENDLWYDKETNILYIWREYEGEWGWVPINDFSTLAIRERKIFTPDNFPEDNQTFMFDKDEVNLFYVPDTSALEIIIDNTPLMSDQFDEIVVKSDKDYLSNGIGFRLKDPLDRPTFVECIIHHSVRSKPVKETFQRAAIFIDENHVYYTNSNAEKIFITTAPYVIGEDQLEIFVDGKRLVKDVEFLEMADEHTDITDNNFEANRKRMSHYYKIKTDLQEGQLIAYKISKHVWSYDHLDMMMHEIEQKANTALTKCNELRHDLTELNNNTVSQIQALEHDLQDFIKAFGSPEDYLKTDSPILESNLPQSIKNKLIVGQETHLIPSTEPIVLNNIKMTDFITVTYISNTLNRNLIKDTEYAITQEDKNIRISITDEFMSSDANIYIQILKIGDR